MNNIRDTSNTSQPRDNSKTARRYLDMTGIQSVLNIEHVTEISVNKPGTIWFEGKNGWESKDAGFYLLFPSMPVAMRFQGLSVLINSVIKST
ncbi:hypothetical protein [Escherichia coli]|uniref:hypothetical protein n=1 Tax=Escherichia coli TaxID=562 RepID=UPI000A7139D3|nr:hypothetical protein [Escherichia coli]